MPKDSSKIDRNFRRRLLKPLVMRKSAPATHTLLESALDQLNRSAFAADLVPLIAKERGDAKARAKAGPAKYAHKDAAYAQLTVDFAYACLSANRLSLQEYTHIVAYTCNALCDARIGDGAYPELAAISEKIRLVEKQHGLVDGRYWSRDEGPEEFVKLNDEFDAICETRLIETMVELGADDVAELYKGNKREYQRLAERGRRSIFHKDETPHALADAIIRYEQEAQAAALTKAYTAAIVMLGAALEGLLLMRCLRSRKKAIEVASSLPKQKRPRDTAKPTAWTLDQLIETCLKAGWLPVVETNMYKIQPGSLAHLLRGMRNYVHPGRYAMERPWIEAEVRDFQLALAIYTTIFAATSKGRFRKLLEEANSAQLQI